MYKTPVRDLQSLIEHWRFIARKSFAFLKYLGWNFHYQYGDSSRNLTTFTFFFIDGLDDLLIGAPGYLERGHKNQGCVFVLTDISGNYGIDVIGLPKICSEENNHYGRFGHSIATSQLSEAKNEAGSLDFIGKRNF